MKKSAQHPTSSSPYASPANAERMAQLPERARQLLAREPALLQSMATPEDHAYFAKHCHYSIEYVAAACTRFAERPCLGHRRGDEPFSTITFAQTWRQVRDVAAAWKATGAVKTGDTVGILGFASPDWAVADIACLYLAAVSVPLRTSVGNDELAYMINDSKLRVVVCSAEQLAALVAILPQCPTVERIYVMDAYVLPDVAAPVGVAISLLTQLRELGRSSPEASFVIPGKDTAETDPLMSIVYTSGSTGRPKGALFPESIWCHSFHGGFFTVLPTLPQVALGFLPLNHIAGRGNLFNTMMGGGVTHFVQKSDLSTLFDDFRAARPTGLFLVPRIAETIFQTFKWRCAKIGDVDDPAVQKQVMQDMRTHYLGDRLLSATVGTAPTAPEVIDFIRDCFEIPVLNGYGATENGIVTFEDHIVRSAVTDYKLVDVPELGYFVTDKPYPRGELRVKSPRVIPGYLNRPEATAELRDAEGFMRTGDIVEERAPDHVVWIDRKQNVIKLSQGEFVGVTRLESVFVGSSRIIQQIYIYGNSARAYLLAVVAPNREANVPGGDLRKAVRAELDRIGLDHQLQGYEIPRDFILSDTDFTKENGLLTESEKPARQKLKAHFAEALENLYKNIENNASRGLRALREAQGLPVEERVRRCVAMTLGLSEDSLTNTDNSFIQAGGDSMSAVRLVDLLDQVCGIAPPVGMVLDAHTSVTQIADFITHAQQSGSGSLTCEQAHGHSQGMLAVSDIKLERFLPDADALVSAAMPLREGPPRNILLTGATGFLGRFLVLELLQNLQPSEGELVCLVRAKNDADALRRLRAEFGKSGDAALKRLDSMSSKLHVVAGDLIQPHFGLEPARYNRLCAGIDTVLHNGALVNHALSYAQMFEPNVLGTVEIMRFALTGRRKRVNFMSTVAVPAGARAQGTINESETGRMLWDERPMEGSYAAGYAASKWACEVLLQDFSERFHIPTQVFRASMIMGHTRMPGQVNPTDFVTRLLHGIVHTGVAPQSFGRSPEDTTHFDGSPVDFVAGSVAAITCQDNKGYQTYHVINPHNDDGVGMDRIVDWVASAGYSIERFKHYGLWFSAFSKRLEALDDAERARSPWPILYRWEAPSENQGGAKLDASVFRGAVARCTAWQDAPHLDEAYIHQYLAHMAHLGLIAPAEDASEGAERAFKGAESQAFHPSAH